jgi:ketosteroid isomerase-like protein
VRAPSAVLAIGLVAAGGCALLGRNRQAPAPRQSPTRDSLLAIDATRNDSLARLGVAAIMRRLLDPSVIYLRAGAHPAYGADRAMRLLETPNPRSSPFTAWQPIGGGISRDRLTGYTFGIAVRTQPEMPGVRIERYIAMWTRGVSSPWRIAAYVEVTPGSLSISPGDKAPPANVGRGPAGELMAIDSVFGERASSLGAAAAMRDFLSDDGVLLATTQLIVGPRAGAEYFESRRSFSISWVPRDARVAASNDLGYTIGDALSTSLGPTGAATQRFTKYLTVWRRDEDGHWRVVATGANDRPSPIGN